MDGGALTGVLYPSACQPARFMSRAAQCAAAGLHLVSVGGKAWTRGAKIAKFKGGLVV